MRYTLALTFAVFALISNVAAVTESDVNENPYTAAYTKSEAYKAKFNVFDGQIHETDGSSYNKGDGI